MKAAKHRDASEDPRVVEMRKELARKIANRAVQEADTHTEIPGLRLYRRSSTTACMSAAYEPSLVVFVQGRKRINVGKTIYICDGSNFLLTSVELPVVSQVISATQKVPILGLILKLEMPAVREILSQQEFICAKNPPTPAPWLSASLRSNSSMHVSVSSTCSILPMTFPFSPTSSSAKLSIGCSAVRRESISAPSPRWASKPPDSKGCRMAQDELHQTVAR